jgi:hypothetical protein
MQDRQHGAGQCLVFLNNGFDLVQVDRRVRRNYLRTWLDLHLHDSLLPVFDVTKGAQNGCSCYDSMHLDRRTAVRPESVLQLLLASCLFNRRTGIAAHPA